MSLGNELFLTSHSHRVKPNLVQLNTAAVTAPAVKKGADDFTAYHIAHTNNSETSSSYCDAVLQSDN